MTTQPSGIHDGEHQVSPPCDECHGTGYDRFDRQCAYCRGHGHWCDECSGATHAPWCPAYAQPESESNPTVFPLEHPPLLSLSEAEAYRAGYAKGWGDAHTETLRLQNEDMREMLRVGRERVGR